MMASFKNLFLTVVLFIAISSHFDAKSLKRHLTPKQLEQLSRNVRTYRNPRSTEHESTNSTTDHGSGGHSSGGEGGHSSPSYMLKLHSYSYEPEGYSMSLSTVNSQTSIVSFIYNKTDSPYHEYIFRVRFHGEHEYATEAQHIEVGENGTNKLILKKFLDDPYIICVTFLSNDSSVLPLATSGKLTKKKN